MGFIGLWREQFDAQAPEQARLLFRTTRTQPRSPC